MSTSINKPWQNRPEGVAEYMPYVMNPEAVVRMNPNPQSMTYTPIVKFGWEHYIVGRDCDTKAEAKKAAQRAAELFRIHLQKAADDYLGDYQWQVDHG